MYRFCLSNIQCILCVRELSAIYFEVYFVQSRIASFEHPTIARVARLLVLTLAILNADQPIRRRTTQRKSGNDSCFNSLSLVRPTAM